MYMYSFITHACIHTSHIYISYVLHTTFMQSSLTGLRWESHSPGWPCNLLSIVPPSLQANPWVLTFWNHKIAQCLSCFTNNINSLSLQFPPQCPVPPILSMVIKFRSQLHSIPFFIQATQLNPHVSSSKFIHGVPLGEVGCGSP